MNKEAKAAFEERQKRSGLRKRIVAIIIVSLLIIGLVVTPLVGLFM